MISENRNIIYDAIYDYIPDDSVNGKKLSEVLEFVESHTRLSSFVIGTIHEGKGKKPFFIYECKESSKWECPDELLDEKVINATVGGNIQLIWIPWKEGYKTFKKKHRWTL